MKRTVSSLSAAGLPADFVDCRLVRAVPGEGTSSSVPRGRER